MGTLGGNAQAAAHATVLRDDVWQLQCLVVQGAQRGGPPPLWLFSAFLTCEGRTREVAPLT